MASSIAAECFDFLKKNVEKQKAKNFCQITMSYFGLIDVRISVSEKEQPVKTSAFAFEY